MMICAQCGFVIERIGDSCRGFSTGEGRTWRTNCLIQHLKHREDE